MIDLGIKIIDQGEGFKVIKFAWWIPDAAITRALENIRKDGAVLGKTLTFYRGHRLVRISGL